MTGLANRSNDNDILEELEDYICEIVSETNGITLEDTLELMLSTSVKPRPREVYEVVGDFRRCLSDFQIDQADINTLLKHPFARALYRFLRSFPLPYREEHIHLTGSLNAEFIFPRLKKLLDGPAGPQLEKKIKAVYGDDSLPLTSPADVKQLIELKDMERFDRYLKILMLPKLILTDAQTHREAAYHMAKELYEKYNVGHIRLKFTLSRANSSDESEVIPGVENLSSEDVVLALYEGFSTFQGEQPNFSFVLSPCFRKETDFFNSKKFQNKREDIENQIQIILDILDKHPHLEKYLCDVDTVGDEKSFYSKSHFLDMRNGFRKLQYRGFQIRSHHGETWRTLKRGIQSVDNAMNIWQIDTLEHGLSLGINPNYYFHSFFQRVLKWNANGEKIYLDSPEYNELMEMLWNGHEAVRDKILRGQKLSEQEVTLFTKAKFHTAREVEQYQHDVLNRMIQKNVSLISLPSSNYKLTACFEDFKDHPFSWWEKKGVKLGVGTDNYVTLNTDYLNEMLILLFTDPNGLKITKLLMVTTGETRRPYLSHLLWEMRKQRSEKKA